MHYIATMTSSSFMDTSVAEAVRNRVIHRCRPVKNSPMSSEPKSELSHASRVSLKKRSTVGKPAATGTALDEFLLSADLPQIISVCSLCCALHQMCKTESEQSSNSVTASTSPRCTSAAFEVNTSPKT